MGATELTDTLAVGPGEGSLLFASTGTDDQFDRAVRWARRLSAVTSRLDLPPFIELPTDRPVIVAANHSSLFDLVASLITVGHYGGRARLGIHARYFERPGMGAGLRRIGSIPFSSERAAEAEETMVAALGQGQLCCLMPEGRIVRADQRVDGVVGQGRTGISRIARAADAAILPVGFAGADRAWRPGRALPRVGRRTPIRVRIGRPLVLDGADHRVNADAVMATISELVAGP